MNSDKPDKVRDDVDSWQELAKDLLGVESNDELADDLILPDDDGELLDFDVEDESTDTPDTPADVADEAVVPDSEPESTVSDPEGTTPELTEEFEQIEEVESSDAVSDQQKADDPYWDALEDWTWEDEGRSRSPASATTADTGAARVPETAETPDDNVSSPSVTNRPVVSRSDDYLDAPSFGIGVLDDDLPTASSPNDAGVDSTKSTTKAADSVTEGAGGPPEAVAAPDFAEGADAPASVSDEAGLSDTAAENVSDAASTVAAADSTEPSAVPTGAKRRRRRRRRKPRATNKETELKPAEEPVKEAPAESPPEQMDVPKKRVRRRGRPRKKEATPVESPAAEETSDTVEDAVADSQEPPDAKPVTTPTRAKHRDVPTWEEAISYLLEPSRVGVSPPKKSASAKEN